MQVKCKFTSQIVSREKYLGFLKLVRPFTDMSHQKIYKYIKRKNMNTRKNCDRQFKTGRTCHWSSVVYNPEVRQESKKIRFQFLGAKCTAIYGGTCYNYD